jgi:acyl-CoA thioesterase I
MRMRTRWSPLSHACQFGLLFALVSWACPAAASKIACVGDSITYGYNLSNPSTESYPAVLQTLLGSAHTVKNFGSSGCTLLKKGDKPYWNDAQYSASDAFKPDVVVVMLGTNDAKPQNWSYQADFTGDYDSLIDHYWGLGALVYVAVPPPVVSPGSYQIDPNVLNTQIVPLIRQIATAANAPTIDVYQAFNGKPNLLPDTVHPNAEGAKLIAQTVQAALQQGGFGGYAGTGGASSTGGTQASGGVKNTGGAPASGGLVGTGGLSSTGGRSATFLGLGGTLNTGGVATTLVSSGGNLSAGGASRGSGGATTGSTMKSTGGSQNTGGIPNTAGTTNDATGGLSASGGVQTTGKSSVGGSSSNGGTSSNSISTGGTSAATPSGQAGSSPTTGGAGQDSSKTSSSVAAASQATNPDGCGCRVRGQDSNGLAAWPLALLTLSLLRRRHAPAAFGPAA